MSLKTTRYNMKFITLRNFALFLQLIKIIFFSLGLVFTLKNNGLIYISFFNPLCNTQSASVLSYLAKSSNLRKGLIIKLINI